MRNRAYGKEVSRRLELGKKIVVTVRKVMPSLTKEPSVLTPAEFVSGKETEVMC